MCNNRLYVVMYHYVRDLMNSRYPGIKGMDLHLFKEQIKFFKAKFNIITMEEVIDAYTNCNKLPENAMLLTFDDGYMDHFINVFPFLFKEKVQGSFFVPGKTFVEHKLLDVNKIHFILASKDIQILKSELFKQMDYYRGTEFSYPVNKELYDEYAVENRFDDKDTVFVKRILQVVLPEELRNIITSNIFEQYVGIPEEKFARELYMSREQILCMKNSGMFIGIHGYDHYWLGRLEKEKMRADICKALNVMGEFIDKKVWVMNYPYGDYNNDVVELLRNSGCILGFTTEVRAADINNASRYSIPRLDTNDFPPKSNNYLKY